MKNIFNLKKKIKQSKKTQELFECKEEYCYKPVGVIFGALIILIMKVI